MEGRANPKQTTIGIWLIRFVLIGVALLPIASDKITDFGFLPPMLLPFIISPGSSRALGWSMLIGLALLILSVVAFYFWVL